MGGGSKKRQGGNGRKSSQGSPAAGAEHPAGDDLRLNPQARLCNKFDGTGIAEFRVASPERMGFRVLDDCAEEHRM